MAVTTDDCKAFLADFFAKHPSLIFDIYDNDHANEDARTASKWRRDAKMSAAKYFEEYDSSVEQSANGPTVTVYPDGNPRQMPLADIVTVRRFVLDPKAYDSGVSYLVLEDKTGALHLGEYVGD